jgi:hypothetical protein
MGATQKPTPEDVVEQLRVIGSQLKGHLKPLSFAERRDLRNKIRTSEDGLHSSVSIINGSDKVAHVLGRSAEDVLEILFDRQRWYAVESELLTLLNGVSGANLIRRNELESIAGQAYAIAARLVRDPANAALIPLVENMQRLRKLDRRRKTRRTAPEATPEP